MYLYRQDRFCIQFEINEMEDIMKLYLYSGAGQLALINATSKQQAKDYVGRYDDLEAIKSWDIKEICKWHNSYGKRTIPTDAHGKCKILWIKE